MKLVGADSGHYEHEELVEEALLAPSGGLSSTSSSRRRGKLALEHRTPDRSYRLAAVEVGEEPVDTVLKEHFDELRTHPDMQSAKSESWRCSTLRPTRPSRSLPRWTL